MVTEDDVSQVNCFTGATVVAYTTLKAFVSS
jgi:hypothetical protein